MFGAGTLTGRCGWVLPMLCVCLGPTSCDSEYYTFTLGPSTGDPQCRMSILRNGNVPCRYFCNFHVDFRTSPVEFKDRPMSLIFFPMSLGSMSHVDFKKWQCRPVDFKGQGLPPCRPSPIGRHSPSPAPSCLFIRDWSLIVGRRGGGLQNGKIETFCAPPPSPDRVKPFTHTPPFF